jgi:hypothetical protein
VARQAAELVRLHVLDALVGGRAQEDEVHDRQHSDHGQAATHVGEVEVDVRVDGRQRPISLQAAAAEEDARRDQHQAQHEYGGQDQEEEDSLVGMGGAVANDLRDPEHDHGQSGARGERRAGQGQRVLAEIRERTHPLADARARRHGRDPRLPTNDPPATVPGSIADPTASR